MSSFAKTYTLTETQKGLRAALIASLAITIPFVFLRCFVRARVQSQFSTDDYLLATALVAFAIQQSISLYAIDYGGYGRKTSNLPLDVFLKGLKWLVISECAYAIAVTLAKLSIAFLQLRVIGISIRMLRRMHYATVGINVASGLYELFTLIFQCYPNGNPIILVGVTYKCTSRRAVVISFYLYSAISILLDWYYSFAIAPVIWKLQNMRTVVKISVILILGMGFFASIATIIRLKHIIGLDDSPDPLLAIVPATIWSSVEQCMGMCAACIATFRPLLRLIPGLASSRGGSNGSPSACRNGDGGVDGDAGLSVTWKSRLTERLRRGMRVGEADELSLEYLQRASVMDGESRSEDAFARAATALPGEDGQHAFRDVQAEIASGATSKDGVEVGAVADDAESQRSILYHE